METLNGYDRGKAAQSFTSPQYMTAHMEFEGEIDEGLLERCFNKILEVNKPRFSSKPSVQAREWVGATFGNCYSSVVSNDFHQIREMKAVKGYASTVADANGAPVVLTLIKHETEPKFMLLYLFNHVFGDALSANNFHFKMVETYNEALNSDAPNPEPFPFLSELDFLKAEMKGWNIFFRYGFFFFFIAWCIKMCWSTFLSFFRTIKQPAKLPVNGEEVLSVKIINIKRKTLKKRDSGITLHAQIFAAVGKSFLRLKGEEISSKVHFTIPVSLRKNCTEAYGNYLVGSPQGIDEKLNLVEMQQKLQKSMNKLTKTPFIYADYLLVKIVFHFLSEKLLVALCDGVSKSHHYLIGVMGYMDRKHIKELSFDSCKVVGAGGNNYPGQGQNGMSLSVGYRKGYISLGIAYLNSAFTENDIEIFAENIEELLINGD